MNFSHAFFKVHTVIFHRCNANISTGCQRPTFFPDFSSGSNFAKAGNILIGSLAELLIEPLGVFGDSQNFLFFCDSIVILSLRFLLVLLCGGSNCFFCFFSESLDLLLHRRHCVSKGLITQNCVVLCKKRMVLLYLSAIQPDDGIQVFHLPFAPLVECAVNDCVVVAGINEEHLVL